MADSTKNSQFCGIGHFKMANFRYLSGTYLQTQFCYRATNTFPLPGPPTPHNECVMR